MISKETFTLEHIIKVKGNKSSDISIVERNIYALGLLENLGRVGLPFIFKGGTSLTLLLNKVNRLSYDIDIVVEPSIDVIPYIEKAKSIDPFLYYVDITKNNRPGINKKHFEFYYESFAFKDMFYIKLDILFEHNNYAKLINKEIKNELLLTEPPYQTIKIPSIDCILADKLTAFAPNTIGIPFIQEKGQNNFINGNEYDNKKKRRQFRTNKLEIVKQMYDVCTLFEYFSYSKDIYNSYIEIAKSEILYRKNNTNHPQEITVNQALMDSFMTAYTFIESDAKNETYKKLVDGCRKLIPHIYNGSFSSEIAKTKACFIMYLTSCIYTKTEIKRINDYKPYIKADISATNYPRLKTIRNIAPLEFAYGVKALILLNENVKNIETK